MITNREQSIKERNIGVKIKLPTCGRNQPRSGQDDLIFPFILFSGVAVFIDVKRVNIYRVLIRCEWFLVST